MCRKKRDIKAIENEMVNDVWRQIETIRSELCSEVKKCLIQLPKRNDSYEFTMQKMEKLSSSKDSVQKVPVVNCSPIQIEIVQLDQSRP
jgi:hypothetical protein